MSNMYKNPDDDILNLVNSCVSCLKNGGDNRDILYEILKSFDADDAVFLSAENNHQGVDLVHSFVLRKDRKFLDKYADYYWRYDPLYTIQFYAEPSSPAFTTDDVIPYSQLVNLEYYNSFLRPQNLLGELIIRLCSKDSVFGAISLQRLKEHPNFGKKDTRKASLLAPFLANIFETGDRFTRINDERILLKQWMESYSEGIILLDSDYKPLYLNSKARLFCSHINGANKKASTEDSSTEMFIPRIILRDCMNMTVMQKSSDFFKSNDNRIINISPSKRYYLQYFSAAWLKTELPVPCFIVFLNELTKYGTGIEEYLKTEEKLTEREEIIAQYVSVGLSNKQIADKLCLSPFTVQNHMKSIFWKTGLDSRTKLANLLKYSDLP